MFAYQLEHLAVRTTVPWRQPLGHGFLVLRPTEMTDEVFQTDMGKALMATFPRRRLCDMESLNVPLLFLCSDMAQGVTGSVFTVDDGQSL